MRILWFNAAEFVEALENGEVTGEYFLSDLIWNDLIDLVVTDRDIASVISRNAMVLFLNARYVEEVKDLVGLAERVLRETD